MERSFGSGVKWEGPFGNAFKQDTLKRKGSFVLHRILYVQTALLVGWLNTLAFSHSQAGPLQAAYSFYDSSKFRTGEVWGGLLIFRTSALTAYFAFIQILESFREDLYTSKCFELQPLKLNKLIRREEQKETVLAAF